MQSTIYSLPDDILLSIFILFFNQNPYNVSCFYVSHIFRKNYLDTVSFILNRSLNIRLCPKTHSKDLFMYATFSPTMFNRRQYRDFTAYSEKKVRSMFGSRNVSLISFDDFMISHYVNTPNFSLDVFLRHRTSRISRTRELDIRRGSSRSARQGFIDDLCFSLNLLVIPYDLIAYVRAFVLSNQSSPENIRERFVSHKQMVDQGIVPENYFQFMSVASGPLVIERTNESKNIWILITRCVRNFRSSVTWVESYSEDTKTFLFAFKISQNEARHLKACKINDVGDSILFFKSDPWLRCYSRDGTIIWSLKRQFFSMFANPKQLLVGKSGVIYLSDPLSCHIHRISPSGIPIAPIHWNATPLELICLTSCENIVISPRTSSPTIFVLDWQGNYIQSTILLNSSPRQINSSACGSWVVQDELSRSIKVYPESGGNFFQEIPAWNRKSNLIHCLPDNKLAIYIEQRSIVETYKILKAPPLKAAPI